MLSYSRLDNSYIIFNAIMIHGLGSAVTDNIAGSRIRYFLSLVVVQAQALHSAIHNGTSDIRQCVYASS